jgi:hypothetical protein
VTTTKISEFLLGSCQIVRFAKPMTVISGWKLPTKKKTENVGILLDHVELG